MWNLILTLKTSDEDEYLSDDDSIVSDHSDEYMFPQFSKYSGNVSDVTNSIPKRNYRTEHEKLKDSLSKEFPQNRTRSGKN